MRYLHTLDWDEIRDLLESQDPEDEPEDEPETQEIDNP